MFKWPWKKESIQELVVVPTEAAQVFVAPPVVNGSLRKGMWVKTAAGSVGILTGFGDSTVDVTMTTGSGETVMVVVEDRMVPKVETVLSSQVAQAKYEDIPAPRRPPLDIAVSLGYGDR